jgi:dihydrofolate synthase/folylpolyglutamate synthase
MENTYLPGADPRVIRLELGRVEELLHRLGDPHLGLNYLHVAGTNGKGSVSALMSAMLTAAGYRVGLFTSPALSRFNERIQLCTQPIPDQELEPLLRQVNHLCDGMEDTPTEFERATALALCWFRQKGCDLVILEVGLGGGGDATNVIPAPEVSVLVSMGLDHTRILGPTLHDIAQAKAGILKPGTRAVSYGNEQEAEGVFSSRCQALGIPYVVMDRGRVSHLSCSLEGCSFQLAPYGRVSIPLVGSYQPYNALLAVTAMEALREQGWAVSDEAMVEGLKQVVWPGRFELLRREPLFFLDGSHNPQGLAATVDSIRLVLGDKKPVILMGVMADKDVPAMLRLLLPVAQEFVTVTPHNPRAMPGEELAQMIRRAGGKATASPTIPQGVETAVGIAGPQGAVCALGTLYFSGDVRDAVAVL